MLCWSKPPTRCDMTRGGALLPKSERCIPLSQSDWVSSISGFSEEKQKLWRGNAIVQRNVDPTLVLAATDFPGSPHMHAGAYVLDPTASRSDSVRSQRAEFSIICVSASMPGVAAVSARSSSLPSSAIRRGQVLAKTMQNRWIVRCSENALGSHRTSGAASGNEFGRPLLRRRGTRPDGSASRSISRSAERRGRRFSSPSASSTRFAPGDCGIATQRGKHAGNPAQPYARRLHRAWSPKTGLWVIDFVDAPARRSQKWVTSLIGIAARADSMHARSHAC